MENEMKNKFIWCKKLGLEKFMENEYYTWISKYFCDKLIFDFKRP